MRVLVASPYLPHPEIGHGGGVSVREQTRHLARRHEVTLLALLRPGEEHLVAATAADLGCAVRTLPFADRGAGGAARAALLASRARALLRGLRRGYPYYVEKYWSPGLGRAFVAAVAAADPEVVQCEYMQSALLLRDLRRWRDARRDRGEPAPRLCLGSHELGSVPRRRRATRLRGSWRAWPLRHQARAWRRLQRDATRWADVTFCVTDADRALLEADGGISCVTVPLGVDTDAIRPVREPASPARLLFVGSFGHGPNRTAVEFLIDRVWPTVAQYDQECVCDIVGAGSRRFLARLGVADRRLRAHGFVPSLEEFYRRSRLLAAPLPEGGGIKIKILEAMAHGLPVVTTPVGAEGIVRESDRAAWIAPPDDAFAAAVIAALKDPGEAERRGGAARRLMTERFSWQVIVDRLGEHYRRG